MLTNYSIVFRNMYEKMYIVYLKNCSTSINKKMFHVRTKNVYWILKISRHVLIKPMKNNKQRKKKSIEKPEKMK